MYTEHYFFLVIVFMRQLSLHVSDTRIFFFISISVLKTVNFGNGAELKLNDLVKEIQVLKRIAHHVPCVFEEEDLIVPRLTLLCKRPRRNLPQIAMEKLSEKAFIAVCVTAKDFAA